MGSQSESHFLSGKSSGQNPANATTYYMALAVGALTGDPVTSPATVAEAFVPNVLVPALIVGAYINVIVSGTLGSAQQATFSVRVNNTTDFQLSNAVNFTAILNNLAITGLAIPLNAGDFFQVKILTPTWTPSLPTAVFIGVRLVVRYN